MSAHPDRAPTPSPRRPRRRWLRALLAVAALLLVAVLALAAWLLHSTGGRDRALVWLAASLPAGSQLTWARASGTLAGGLRLEDVHLRLPMQDCSANVSPCEMRLDARVLALRVAPRALLTRRVAIEQLRLDHAVLRLPTRDTPFELPQWPGLLPTLDLPLGVAFKDARIEALEVRRDVAPLLVIRHATLTATLDPGALHVAALRADTDHGTLTLAGQYLPRARHATDLTATWARPGAVAALVARGDLARMDVAVSALAPQRTRLWLRLDGTAPVRWRARGESAGLDPARLLGGDAGTPWTFTLDAHGEDGRADAQGRVAQGDLAFDIAPSRLQLGPRTLGFAPLQVGLLGGSARAEGLLRFDAPARLDLQMAARGLSWRASAQATPVHADADLRLTGVPSRWRVDGGGTLTRAGQQARWTLRARGDTAQATLDSLTIRTPAGRLQAEGQVGWSPRLAWQAKATLRDFDPGYLAPGFEGAIHGELLGRGERDARGAWQARVQAPSLAGRLRGRALQARADWQQQGTTQRGTLDLALGASRVKARAELGTRLDVQAEFAPLQLDDLHPDARGRVQGTLALQGTRTVPGLRVDLEGESLAWQGQRAARVQAHGQLPATGRDGALRLTGDGLHLGDVGVRRATIALDGSLAAFDLHADLDGELAHAVLDGHAEHRGNAWRGTLATFALTPVRGPAWSLERPVAWQHSPGRLHLGEACLHTTGPARACLHGTWPQPGLAMDAEGLPLALLDTWWTPRAAGLDADWRGRVDLHALLAQGSGGWHGTLEARGHDLALRGRGARYDTLATHGLVLSATLTAQGYAGELTATLAGGDCGQRACTGGPLHAQLHGGWAADAALSGQLDLATDSVTWLELLSPDLVAPQGHLTAQLRVGGTPGTPLLAGEARIDNLDAELPALAIGIQQGRVELIAAADGSATLHGALPTGRGALAVTGSLDWHDAATPLSLRLQGSNVLIADTPALTAVVSPDLTLDWKRGAALRLAGRVSVDEARMDLQRLDLGVSASPDVVVLDPADPDRAPDTPLALDLQLVLGDQVTLSGHGLDGRLGGTLAIKGGDGVPMRGNGELTVRGRYRAYGSQLDITKGQLWWQDDAIDNPQVALRAERRVGDVTAGLDVSGRLDAPHATAWTDPASSEQDALAYLTLGRPLSSLSAGDAGKVDAAQAALNAGGGLLASQLAARLGLDDAGVSDSRALGGQVFGIGKQLSPRLYINYGVSLLGSGQVVLLRYLLGRGFDVQIESSTRESRGSLNWRKEK